MDTAKIAAIALHTARLIYPRQGSLMHCFDTLLGCGKSLFGSTGFLFPAQGNPSKSLSGIDNPTEAGAGRRNFPGAGNFPPARRRWISAAHPARP
jgi:hypothetical protein